MASPTSSRILQTMKALTIAVPPLIFIRDNFYSLYRVTGTSMEPSLYDGDILLVRKSDVLPYQQWQRWTSHSNKDGIDGNQSSLRVMALDVQSERPIGDTITGYTFLRPPTIHIPGSVVVFRAPDAEKYPCSEYRIKRVIALGGQIVRNGTNRFRLEKVPCFNLWVEGDNVNINSDGQNESSESIDSRIYGSISKNLVIGVAERLVWPPTRWGLIPCVTSPVPRSWWP